jgi:lantibiotic modifying enzyme
MTYGALGGDLYDGTSGIAVFLADLAVETGDELVRHTALGAIRQAIKAAPADSGLYTGGLGIAFAAARIGTRLDIPDLLEAARRTAAHVNPRPLPDGHFDVLTGRAGAIIGQLAIADALSEPMLVDQAEHWAQELIVSADRGEHGWSWRAPNGQPHRDLTGFSHGAAGVGHAFVELYAATGESVYRKAALAAFLYERRWFSRDVENWPDFRDEPARRVHDPSRAVFRSYWCHGAPGIALTRLRAHEVLDDPHCLEEARAGLRTTVRETMSGLADGSLSYCMCHGLAGNADVLLTAMRLLNGASETLGPIVEEIARRGATNHIDGGQPWPCGIPISGQETPGLMLGLAGIGQFYLRLARPDSVTSVLSPGPACKADAVAIASYGR